MIDLIVNWLASPFWLAAGTKKKPVAKPARKPLRPAKRVPARAPKQAKGKPSVVRAPEASEPEELAIEPPPPPVAPVQAPGLFSPSANEIAESLTPSFRWFYVGGASHYQLVWSLDTHFHKQHILLTTQTAASLPIEQALEPDSAYVWKVRGGNAGGWGPWSPVYTFKTPDV